MSDDEGMQSLKVELLWCKAVIADLQRQLDNKQQALLAYEQLVREALGKLDGMLKGGCNATECASRNDGSRVA